MVVGNQKECHEECLDNGDSVGISHGYNDEKWKLCYTYKDDILSKETIHGFGFYRKPIIGGKKFNRKIFCSEIETFYNHKKWYQELSCILHR